MLLTKLEFFLENLFLFEPFFVVSCQWKASTSCPIRMSFRSTQRKNLESNNSKNNNNMKNHFFFGTLRNLFCHTLFTFLCLNLTIKADQFKFTLYLFHYFNVTWPMYLLNQFTLIGRDSNPRPFNHESSSPPTRLDFLPLYRYFLLPSFHSLTWRSQIKRNGKIFFSHL